MPHIHTGQNQHDHTVTAYIIRTDKNEPVALLHMHRKLKKLLPVGGHIELTETPWQAMKHEIEEESGYSLDDLSLLQPPNHIKSLSDATLHPHPVSMNTHPITEDHFHTDISYAFVTEKLPTRSIDKRESSEFHLLSKRELNAITQPEINLNTKEVYNFIFERCLQEWDRVDPASYSY